MPSLPVIDIAPLHDRAPLHAPRAAAVADAIGRALGEYGFFYLIGHGVPASLQTRLERLARAFFAQDLDRKLAIRMARGGRAWRGYFALGDELTSGRPDWKEGLYLGAEHGDDHPKVAAGVPLFGRNLFPETPPELGPAALAYMAALTRLGHTVMTGLALSLDLEPSYFADRYTRDPLILFRLFNYPPLPRSRASQPPWSVGEHTDYGLLTLLRQDRVGGLQVESPRGWIDVPPVPGSFVCNIGDMLDRMTGGVYRSTPHRVRNPGATDRLSMAFFFDPSFDAEIQPIVPGAAVADDRDRRWDRASVHELGGTYGEYLLGKVARVFPHLGRDVL